MNEASFEGSPPPVSAPKPAENLINLQTSVPAESVSARPVDTPTPVTASSSETASPAQPQTLGEQVTGEPAIQVAGKGMSVDSMRQAVAGEVPDPTQNTLQTASENQSVANLQAAAEATPAVTIRQKVEVFAQSISEKLGDEPMTPESVTQVLVDGEVAKGLTEAQAKQKVEEFRQTWKDRFANLLWAGVEGLEEWWGKGWRASSMGDFINNFFFSTDGRSSYGGEGGWEPEEREKHFTLDEFKSLLQDDPKKAAKSLLEACNGESGLFNQGFVSNKTEQDQMKQALESGEPEKLLEAMNRLCDFLFENEQDQVRADRWRLVRKQYGDYLTQSKRPLSDKIREFLLENYKEKDLEAKQLTKLLKPKTNATSSQSTPVSSVPPSTPAPSPVEASAAYGSDAQG